MRTPTRAHFGHSGDEGQGSQDTGYYRQLLRSEPNGRVVNSAVPVRVVVGDVAQFGRVSNNRRATGTRASRDFRLTIQFA